MTFVPLCPTRLKTALPQRLSEIRDTVSWIVDGIERLTGFVDQAVAGGFVLALGLVCVLQYMLHMYRISEASRRAEQHRQEMQGLEEDLMNAQKDRTLSRLENDILREFVSQTEMERALDLLMNRFLPRVGDGFAAFLCREQDDGPHVVTRCRGLSEPSRQALRLDDDLLQRVTQQRVLVLEGSDLWKTSLLEALAAEDRKKLRELNLIAVGDPGDVVGVLVTTSLYPPGASREHQVELAKRLMVSVAGNLRRSQVLRQREHQLRSTSEMFELRSIPDRTFETPIEMLQEFLARLTEKLGAERGSLYLCAPTEGSPAKALLRCGTELQSSMRPHWQRHEDQLAARHLRERKLTGYDAPSLREAGVETLIGSALLAPLAEDETTIGVLCFTRAQETPFDESKRNLAQWAADYLAETILRVLNQAVVERQARLDGLTQLANRRAFDERIVEAVEAARDGGGRLALLLFDLDHFKSINDTFGHQAGDAALRRAARILQDHASTAGGQGALAARYGGEEMAMLLPDCDLRQAIAVAETIRSAIESECFHFQGNDLPLTVSVGTAVFPVHAQAADDLIAAADAALYRAKAQGRNRVIPADKTAVPQV